MYTHMCTYIYIPSVAIQILIHTHIHIYYVRIHTCSIRGIHVVYIHVLCMYLSICNYRYNIDMHTYKKNPIHAPKCTHSHTLHTFMNTQQKIDADWTTDKGQVQRRFVAKVQDYLMYSNIFI